MNTIDITINRLGSFLLPEEKQNVDNQCGKKGTHSYKYKVSITGDAEHLDDKGFLIDNAVIKSYFEDTYEKERGLANSCELMACAAIEFVKKFCQKGKLDHIKKIYVRIDGSEESYIEAEWNK